MSGIVIAGTTKTCFVVADPVWHLRTPQALNAIWETERRDIVAVSAHVSQAGLGDFICGLRANASAVGAVVTIPHKQRVVELCDELGPNSELVGAVNVIRRHLDGRLIGETFDGLGFVAGLRAEGVEPAPNTKAFVIGAGGAASAVAVALLAARVRSLGIGNRTPSRAAELVDRLRTAFPDADVGTGRGRLSEASLVVNATSTGMNPADGSPIPSEALPAGAVAADVVMSASLTPFLAAAAARGNRTHAGSHMLAGQIRLISQYLAPASDTETQG